MSAHLYGGEKAAARVRKADATTEVARRITDAEIETRKQKNAKNAR
jgi:hypothetical protein